MLPSVPSPAPAATRVALVSGASSGIGEAAAEALARAGFAVAAVARRGERLERGEDIGGTASLVLVIDTSWLAAPSRDGLVDVLEQLLARFVETYDRPGWVVGAVVHLKNVFHRQDERRASA